MSLISWFALLVVVVLGTVGQLALKYAFHPSQSRGTSTSMRGLLFSLYFWIWFICYVLVTALWLIVLRIIPLSQAFPALGLTFALVPLASAHLLGEKVVFTQWLGIVIIVIGVVLVVQR